LFIGFWKSAVNDLLDVERTIVVEIPVAKPLRRPPEDGAAWFLAAT
jgi:hypothetical protein